MSTVSSIGRKDAPTVLDHLARPQDYYLGCLVKCSHLAREIGAQTPITLGGSSGIDHFSVINNAQLYTI